MKAYVEDVYIGIKDPKGLAENINRILGKASEMGKVVDFDLISLPNNSAYVTVVVKYTELEMEVIGYVPTLTESNSVLIES